MASTKSLSFFTPLLSLSPKAPSFFLFPKLPLKTPRNPLPVISCSSPKITEQQVLQSNEKTLHPLPRVTAYDYEDDDDTADEADGGEAADDDDNDNIGSGISAVPKKRTSRSKSKIRKNVWKRKAYFAALKAYSLAKSISTGKSKSFLILDKK